MASRTTARGSTAAGSRVTSSCATATSSPSARRHWRSWRQRASRHSRRPRLRAAPTSARSSRPHSDASSWRSADRTRAAPTERPRATARSQMSSSSESTPSNATCGRCLPSSASFYYLPQNRSCKRAALAAGMLRSGAVTRRDLRARLGTSTFRACRDASFAATLSWSLTAHRRSTVSPSIPASASARVAVGGVLRRPLLVAVPSTADAAWPGVNGRIAHAACSGP